jgi:cell division protein FtsW
VTGEEFGILFCLVLLALFAFVVLPINMAVNVQLMPAKGMTLPFISYGGSSLISLALGMGMLIALTRRRPRAKLEAGANALPARQAM